MEAAIACRTEAVALTKSVEEGVNICLENLKNIGHSCRIKIKPKLKQSFFFPTAPEVISMIIRQSDRLIDLRQLINTRIRHKVRAISRIYAIKICCLT